MRRDSFSIEMASSKRPSSWAYAASWPSDRASMRRLDCARAERGCPRAVAGRARGRRGLRRRPRDRRSRASCGARRPARGIVVDFRRRAAGLAPDRLPRRRSRRERTPNRRFPTHPRARDGSRAPPRRTASRSGTSSPSAITAAPSRALARAAVGRSSLASALSRRRPPSARWLLMTQNRDSAPASCNSSWLSPEAAEPVEGGSQVVVLALEAVEPLRRGFRSSAGSARPPRRVRGSAPRVGARALRPRPSRASRSAAYSRIVSSIQKRSSVWRRRLLSTSDCSMSRSASATSSAASSVQPPREDGEAGEEALLLRRRAARSSTRSSRAACAGARAGLGRRRSGAAGAASSRSRICAEESAFTRAAASSSASGRSSRRRQISETASSPLEVGLDRPRSRQEEADALLVHEAAAPGTPARP